MIPGAANPLLLASAKAGAAYNIERSVRFNAPDSAYLSRTPSVAGNRKTWTWAGWVKRSALGVEQELFSAGVPGTADDGLAILANDTIRAYSFRGSLTSDLRTTQVFRDPSAWFHLVWSWDTDNATTALRSRLFVNGVQVTTFSTSSYPSSGTSSDVNNNIEHSIGSNRPNFAGGYFSGYLADIHFIDGQALDPASFGEFDANGVWQPIEYTGGYGTNGFHLPFSDNSTAAALGTDTSGNSNNFTVNNISVAAGAGNDSLVDTPTSYGTDTGAGGEVRGNYCTWNPLSGTATLSNGNLDSTSTSSPQYPQIRGTIAIPNSGSYYYEITLGAFSGTFYCCHAGVVSLTDSTKNAYAGCNSSSGEKGVYLNSSRVQDLAAWATNDVLGIAVNTTAGTVQFYKNGSTYGTAVTLTTGTYIPWIQPLNQNTSQQPTQFANFGQRPFAYPAPSGFKALCTTNLPEPQTITTSGSYNGNGVADGPFVYLNGVPTAMTVNGTAVTFGTHADKLSNGFKLRTTSTTYNQNAATYNYSVTSTGPAFKTARAQSN